MWLLVNEGPSTQKALALLHCIEEHICCPCLMTIDIVCTRAMLSGAADLGTAHQLPAKRKRIPELMEGADGLCSSPDMIPAAYDNGSGDTMDTTSLCISHEYARAKLQ